jgi:endonuclease III
MAKTKRPKIDKTEAKKRVQKIYPILAKTYPDAECSLDHKSPLQLLISTILAAQCTDVRVNIVAKTIYKKYKNAKAWAAADLNEIEQDIRSTGFYRNKAKCIKNTCDIIVNKFSEKVPDNMDDLLSLPGVGRKTANVILGNVFNTAGVVCDTHVIRLSRRLGLSANADPVKLEFDLMEIVSKRRWTMFSHLMVFHGRSICAARKPKCDTCPIAKHCPAVNNPDLM